MRNTVNGRLLHKVLLGLILLAGLPGAAMEQSLSRGPYLQMGTPDSIVVRWRTTSPVDSRVLYGLAPASLINSVEVPGSTSEHEVTLNELAPGTKYFYAVGSSTELMAGGDAEHFFQTSPTPGTRDPVRVWVIGDSGTADANARAVRDAYESFNGGRHTDLWLMLGDNAYDRGTDAEYQDAVFDMYPRMLRQSVVWPTLGNHDGYGASSDTLSGPYYDIFTLPGTAQAGGVASGTEAYYSFDFGNIHFVCLNSHDVDRSVGGTMLTWLEQDLMNNAQDWTIAFWHHPPYTKGSHNSDSEDQLIDMRENALPILEDWGVDLVLSGHSHSYERSYLLDGHYGSSGTLTDVMKLDAGDGRIDGDGAYAKDAQGPAGHEGAVYVVAGSSGKLSNGGLDHPAMYRSLLMLGSMVLDVEGDRLQAKFLDDEGTLQDYFTVVKNSSALPQVDFAATPTTGPAPLSVAFVDLSTANANSWAWDFDGDGTVDSTERDPTHLYATSGTYTVSLTVSNASGSDTRSRLGYIVVTGQGDSLPPVTGLRRTDKK